MGQLGRKAVGLKETPKKGEKRIRQGNPLKQVLNATLWWARNLQKGGNRQKEKKKLQNWEGTTSHKQTLTPVILKRLVPFKKLQKTL